MYIYTIYNVFTSTLSSSHCVGSEYVPALIAWPLLRWRGGRMFHCSRWTVLLLLLLIACNLLVSAFHTAKCPVTSVHVYILPVAQLPPAEITSTEKIWSMKTRRIREARGLENSWFALGQLNLRRTLVYLFYNGLGAMGRYAGITLRILHPRFPLLGRNWWPGTPNGYWLALLVLINTTQLSMAVFKGSRKDFHRRILRRNNSSLVIAMKRCEDSEAWFLPAASGRSGLLGIIIIYEFLRIQRRSRTPGTFRLVESGKFIVNIISSSKTGEQEKCRGFAGARVSVFIRRH